mmetsp:Transcript_66721/g.168343  ORF Transcript_66721/g.168343 Transcript_66721/m.168343 type:complete len:216 (+) Transcript_66721:1454-2101(+)
MTPTIAPLCELYAGKYTDSCFDWTKAVADFKARFTTIVSSSDQAAEPPVSRFACCKNLCAATGFSMVLPSSSSKPFRRMKLASVLSSEEPSCASDQGKSLEPTSKKDQESCSLLKTAPPATVLSGGASWCLASTPSAALRFSTAWMLSTSMPWNSLSCFSRSAVASANADLSEATSASSSLMLVDSSAVLAVRLSIEEPNSWILAVDFSMASFFS